MTKLPKLSKKKTKPAKPGKDIVASVQAQTAQAAALAGIVGQDRLGDPRLNPALRGTADRLRDEQQGVVLDHQHRRVLRRARVADTRAAEAERALEALAVARQISSPARSVLALHRGRRFYLRLTLAASLVLAAGSARGVDAAAQAMGAPAGTGYIAEIGLTGLTTAAIAYRSHIAEHGGRPDGWQGKVLWALMVVPLLLSAVANAVKAGPVGIACSLGAGAFAVLGYIIAEQSNAAMKARAAEVTATDEERLRAAAMGDDDDAFAPVGGTVTTAVVDVDAMDEDERQGEGQGREGRPGIAGSCDPGTGDLADEVAAEVSAGLPELERWANDRRDGRDGDDGAGEVGPSSPPVAGGPNGAAATVPGTGAAAGQQTGHIDAEAGRTVGVAGGHTDVVQDRQRGQTDGAADGPDRSDRGRDDRADDRDEGQDDADGPDRVAAATRARRQAGAQTRAQIAALMARLPHTTNASICEVLGVSDSTVKRARAALREAGWDQMTREQRMAYAETLRETAGETR